MLIGIVIDEGLVLCNDLKLQQMMKKQNLTKRKELGEFCDQFAYDLNSSILLNIKLKTVIVMKKEANTIEEKKNLSLHLPLLRLNLPNLNENRRKIRVK